MVVSVHAETIEERRALHRVAQQQRAHDGVSLIDDALGQRMVIVPDGATLSVGGKKLLGLERVAAAHDPVINGDEKFVVNGGSRRARQPARLRRAIEHPVLVLARLPKALIELRDRGLVLRTIRLDGDGHE